MKKRSPADIDLFQHESLIHRLSESNSAFIKSSASFIAIPSPPVGKEKTEFAVGDLVKDEKRSFYKTPMTWKVLEVFRQNGFVHYQCELMLTPADLAGGVWKKNDPRTKTRHSQKDLELIERVTQAKFNKSKPRA